MTVYATVQPVEKKVDPVERSLARPDACAKPASLGASKVRIRPMSGNQQKVKIRKKRKHYDKRDVTFY